jgi:pimeloyl-ACP methyl ester carboxylesterase
MTPFYFGSRDRRLFGIYEPAAVSRVVRRNAAVLCYPMGEEYFHAHRPLRHLSRLLAQAGFHTLRFDYYGTGDSDGEIGEVSLCGARMDILAAVEELKAITQVDAVSLVGLRLGASIAAVAASALPAEVNDLILWDPVVTGDRYFHEQALRRVGRETWNARGDPPLPEFDPNFTERVLGEIRDLNLAAVSLPPHVLLISSAESADEARRQMCGLQTTSPLEHIPSPPAWVDHWPKGALPVHLLQRVVEWMSAR